MKDKKVLSQREECRLFYSIVHSLASNTKYPGGLVRLKKVLMSCGGVK